jgi:hypothetical protein
LIRADSTKNPPERQEENAPFPGGYVQYCCPKSTKRRKDEKTKRQVKVRRPAQSFPFPGEEPPCHSTYWKEKKEHYLLSFPHYDSSVSS